MSASLKDLSKKVWTTDETVYPGDERMKLSCLLRIADAVEVMAGNYVQMQRDLEYYKRLYAQRGHEIERLKHSRAGYMAALTRMRNKAAESSEAAEQAFTLVEP